MRLVIGATLCALLASCAQQTLDPSEFDGTPNCGAEALQSLLGRPEAALKDVDLPPATRILRPSDAIALDFSPDRLTIDIDDQGRISSVTCR